MTRISSSLTRFYKIAGPCLGLALLSAFILLFLRNLLVPSLLALTAGILQLVISWKFILPAEEVYLSDLGVQVRGRACERAIPYAQVIEARKIGWIRYPPVIVDYLISPGKRGRIFFIPSYRKYFAPFGTCRIEQLAQTIRGRSEAARVAEARRQDR